MSMATSNEMESHNEDPSRGKPVTTMSKKLVHFSEALHFGGYATALCGFTGRAPFPVEIAHDNRVILGRDEELCEQCLQNTEAALFMLKLRGAVSKECLDGDEAGGLGVYYTEVTFVEDTWLQKKKKRYW